LQFEGGKGMDEMKLKLSDGLMKTVVTKMVSKKISEKFGYKINVDLNEIGITSVDGKVRLHLDANADMANSEFAKLLKTVGLD
jgi:hypothetical protein